MIAVPSSEKTGLGRQINAHLSGHDACGDLLARCACVNVYVSGSSSPLVWIDPKVDECPPAWGAAESSSSTVQEVRVRTRTRKESRKGGHQSLVSGEPQDARF